MLISGFVMPPTDPNQVPLSQSSKTIHIMAIVYSLVLLAGFLYIGLHHGLDLIR
jgi:hypothetical protein